MKYLKLTCLLLFAFSSHAQTDSIVRYWKYRRNGTVPNVETWDINQAVTRAVYFQQGGLWKMESHFIATGRLYMTASYLDAKGSRNEGPLIAYHPNGKIATSTFYKNDKENGLFQAWYENGRISDSFFVRNNLKTGKGFSWDTL